MFQWQHIQQSPINDHLCKFSTKTGAEVYPLRQWLLIKDACIVLSPNEEATCMVSHDIACISHTIILVFLLEHTLHDITDRTVKAEQRE